MSDYEAKVNLSRSLSKLRSTISALTSKVKALEAKIPPDRPQVFRVQALTELNSIKTYDGDLAEVQFDGRIFLLINNVWTEIGSPMYTAPTPDQLPNNVPENALARTTAGVYDGRLYSRKPGNEGWMAANFLGEV